MIDLNNITDEIQRIDDIDDNTVIWRYFNLPKFLHLVCSSNLYFSRADKVSDEFEGEESLPVVNYINYLTSSDDIDSDNLRAYFDPIAMKFKEQFYLMHDQYRKLVYLNCWHINDYQTITMWNQYASDSDGLAIKSSVGNLIKSITSPKYLLLIGKIKYLDYTSENTPFSPIERFYCKKRSFENEKELRLVYVNPIEHQDGQSESEDIEKALAKNMLGKDFNVDLQVLINKIYVAPKMPLWIMNMIEDILAKYNIKKEILLPSKYEV